jgi:hypothetical protein
MNVKDLEYEVDRYRTNKILSGQGLQDDPEWVQKFEQIIDKYEHVDDLAKEDFDY